MTLNNPFEYEAANNLSTEQIVEYFVDDFNYSRFLQSRRNVFVVGDRGSGKTMALLFSSYRVQNVVAKRSKKPFSLARVGIYVPCNTPLTYKPEFELLTEYLSSVLSEHLFVLSIAHAIVDTVSKIPACLEGIDENRFHAEASTVFGATLDMQFSVFDSIRFFLEAQIRDTQRRAHSQNLDEYHQDTFSFASLVMPMLGLLQRNVPALKESHYNLLIDDAHALNAIQQRALNSWIAFRDRSLYSFKIATTRVTAGARQTTSEGSILEGHDYTRIDLERSLHNPRTGFYRLAKKIISRRLLDAGIIASPSDFFPANDLMLQDLKRARSEVRKIAISKFGIEKTKSINDYVYKNARAHYFRSRPSKANRPAYSGFETLVYISTGVVRNLLEPCYWMYDRAVSALEDHTIKSIDPTIQSEVILERSNKAWQLLKERLPSAIEGCSTEQGEQAYRLFDALAVHFRQRLRGTGAEPSANSFTISQKSSETMQHLLPLLNILQNAQMLYVRTGPAKDEGRREEYYVPNRILWPDRGLDPHGQHARVSLTADALWSAALKGKLPLPKSLSEDTHSDLFEND